MHHPGHLLINTLTFIIIVQWWFVVEWLESTCKNKYKHYILLIIIDSATHSYPVLVAGKPSVHVPLKHASSPIATNENIGVTIMMVVSHIGMMHIIH